MSLPAILRFSLEEIIRRVRAKGSGHPRQAVVEGLGSLLARRRLELIIGAPSFSSPHATPASVLPAVLFLAAWYDCRPGVLVVCNRDKRALDRGDRRCARPTARRRRLNRSSAVLRSVLAP